jgi:hypothetical protein
MIGNPQPRTDLSIPLPITRQARLWAKQFASQQPTKHKAQQVYFNTLAVCLVNNYLRIMDIPTDLSAGDSWNPTVRLFFDVADLVVTNIGRLECRPWIESYPQPELYHQGIDTEKLDVPVCYIPPEAQENRIGYVVVQIDEAQDLGLLLGFQETLENEALAIPQLLSPKAFLKYLHQLQYPEPVHLSQWLNHIIEAGWQTLDTLFKPPQTELAFNFRTASGLQLNQPEPSTSEVKRGKILDLKQVDESVVLSVGLTPIRSDKIRICVEVYPTDDHLYLPQELQVILLDEAGKPVIQTEARSTKHIQWRFKADSGDRFSIQVALGDASLTEFFLV